MTRHWGLLVLTTILIATLGCTTPSGGPAFEPGASVQAPPELTLDAPEIDNPTPNEAVARAADSATDASVDAASDRRLFPGLNAEPEPGEILFERSVAERKKRIELGIESAHREQAPVNNVIDWLY